MPDPGPENDIPEQFRDDNPRKADEDAESSGDIMAGDRRLSRPDSSLPDWEMPDAAYRPIPIVWFAAAFLLQMVVLFGLFIMLANQNGWITILLSAMATGAIGAWTWDRGMKSAGNGWKMATIAVLILQLVMVAAGAFGRT